MDLNPTRTAPEFEECVGWGAKGFDESSGTLFAAASGVIEVVFLPENPASFHGWDDRPPQGVFMAIEVPNVEQAYRRATERHLPIREELTTQPWGHRSFCLREPNGLIICVFR